MAGTIEFRIVTPEKGVVSTSVDEVSLPGAEGYFGVLPGHAPFLTYLDIGEISYKADGKQSWFAVSGGFVEVLRDRVTVLAEHCEPAHDIDLERAEDATSKRIWARPLCASAARFGSERRPSKALSARLRCSGRPVLSRSRVRPLRSQATSSATPCANRISGALPGLRAKPSISLWFDRD